MEILACIARSVEEIASSVDISQTSESFLPRAMGDCHRKDDRFSQGVNGNDSTT